MTDILYVISNGFSQRMLLQTGLLGRLADSGLKVAVVCEDASDPVLAEYCKLHSIVVREYRLKNGFSQENYRFKRPYFLEDIRKNTALFEKHIHSIRYNKSAHPLRRIRPYYYYAWYKAAGLMPGIKKWFRESEKKFLRNNEIVKLIGEFRPRLIVATYPVNLLEACVLFNARYFANTHTVIHLLSWDNITTKGHFPCLAEFYIVWGNVMEQELIDYYSVDKGRIFKCGVPHFDLHYEVGREPQPQSYLRDLNLNPDDPYMLFAMSAPRFGPKEIEIVEWLAQKIESGSWGSLQLIVRPHPQNVTGNMADKEWVTRLKKLDHCKRVSIDWPQLANSKTRWSLEMDDMRRLAHLLAGSTITLNSGSTVSIDAMLHNKPVIITSFDADHQLDYWQSARRLVDFLHLKKMLDLGGATVVRSYNELQDAINRYLKEPGWNKQNRLHTIEEECFSNDGQSTDRVMAAVKEIIRVSVN